MNEISNENLHKALGDFIETMRRVIPEQITSYHRLDLSRWADVYYDTLSPKQKNQWDILSGGGPEAKIDFHNLKGFALGQKGMFLDLIGNKAHDLPTWFNDIAEARNKLNHYQNLEQHELMAALLTMIKVAETLSLADLKNNLMKYQEEKKKKVVVKTKTKPKEQKQTTADGPLIPWFKNVTPHLDIRQGQLDESVFAANLAEVVNDGGREVYRNHSLFFEKTYFTMGLKTVSKRVMNGLDCSEDSENRVISLQTGFGGGKTHTLITLYHLAQLGRNSENLSTLKEIWSDGNYPKFEKANIAVFTNTTNDPVQGRECDGLQINTLWGEIAYQLGGEKTYEKVKANDESRTTPKGIFKSVLAEHSPALILIDELADYCVAAAGVTVGGSTLSDQTISFMQELTEAVSSVDGCVLVITLPASVQEVANSHQASTILNSLSSRVSRVGADTKPVEDEEIFEVIRRRLFEDLGSRVEIDNIINRYMHLYQNELIMELPKRASRSGYKELMLKSYPFHPELIEVFRKRWASHHGFQRTRGVLRLLASIVSDLWKRQGSLTGVNALIHMTDVNFSNIDALSGQLKRLWGNEYDAVMIADVTGSSCNAFLIDQAKPEFNKYNITQGLTSAILLGSFGPNSPTNKGLSVDELKLCAVKPDGYNHNSINSALLELENNAHYLYYSSTGTSTRRYWFFTKPNLNILVNQARSEVKDQVINNEILERLNEASRYIQYFNILINPEESIPEQKRLTLAILSPEYRTSNGSYSNGLEKYVKNIALKKGNSERIFRNTILFLACTEPGYGQLADNVREYKACIKIREEYRSQLEKDQLDDLKKRIEDAQRKIHRSLIAGYTEIIKYTAAKGLTRISLTKKNSDRFESHINTTAYEALKEEEWLLDSIGFRTYQTMGLLPDEKKAVRTKDVYETFLRFDDKPMITGIPAVQDSLLKYSMNGQFGIGCGDGTKEGLTAKYIKSTIPHFDVTDDTFWLIPAAWCVEAAIPAADDNSSFAGDSSVIETPYTGVPEPQPEEPAAKEIGKVTISGTVDIANYNQIFSSFILPLKNNGIKIEMKMSGTTNNASPLTENSQVFQIVKEASKQLGLDFEVEE